MPPQYVTQAALETCIAPAAAPIHAALVADLPAPEVIQYGTPIADPAVSIIVPLYKNLEFLRFQLAAFAIDPDDKQLGRSGDHPRPRQPGAAGRASALPARIVRPLRDAADPGGPRRQPRLFQRQQLGRRRRPCPPPAVPQLRRDPRPFRLAAAAVRRTGSLAHDRRRRPQAAVQGRLAPARRPVLGRDYKGRWINQHFHKGMPRDFAPPASPARFPESRAPAC